MGSYTTMWTRTRMSQAEIKTKNVRLSHPRSYVGFLKQNKTRPDREHSINDC